MVPLVLIGSLLRNVFQHGQHHTNHFYHPLDKLYPHPTTKQKEWVHPVIFEPQPKNQLTQSSYKVTSFLDF